MKIYRGPSQKDFSDDAHAHVSDIDLSKDNDPWVDRKKYRANITKYGNDRKADAHIVLEAADIIALHQGLVEGLRQQATQSKVHQASVNTLRKALEDIQRIALATLALRQDETEAIEKIKARAARALNPAKKVVLTPVKR